MSEEKKFTMNVASPEGVIFWSDNICLENCKTDGCCENLDCLDVHLDPDADNDLEMIRAIQRHLAGEEEKLTFVKATHESIAEAIGENSKAIQERMDHVASQSAIERDIADMSRSEVNAEMRERCDLNEDDPRNE